MRCVALSAGAIAFALFVGGCAEPEMLFDFTPVARHGVWYSGNEYVSETKDSVTVSTAFINEIEGTITFYVVVGNGRSEAVLVNPGQIHYEAGYMKLKLKTKYVLTGDIEAEEVSYDTLRGIDTVYGYSPRSELQGINVQMARANATYANNNMLNMTGALLQVVGDVATIGHKETKEQRRQERENRRSLERSEATNNLSYSLESQSLAGQRSYWENVALRRTTLFSGNTVGGQVRMRVDDRATVIKLEIPVGGTNYVFRFRQKPLPGQS